jgi:hypothetical protein
MDLQRHQEDSTKNGNNEIVRPCDKVKIALSLYKVQQNIYLLDFQRIEGRPHIHNIYIYIYIYNIEGRLHIHTWMENMYIYPNP